LDSVKYLNKMENKDFIEIINKLYEKYTSQEYQINGRPNFYIRAGIENRKYALMFESDDFKKLQEKNFKGIDFNGMSIDNTISGEWLSISKLHKCWIEDDFVCTKRENAPVETSRGLEYKTVNHKLKLK